MKSGTTETAPGAAIDPAGAGPAAKVADKTWQRRVLLFDGLLIAMLGWLLWTLYTDRSDPSVPEKTQLEVDAPAVTPPVSEGSVPEGSVPEGSGSETE